MPDRNGERPLFTCIRLELDRAALDVPVVDGQANLAAAAHVTASSVRAGWPVSGLFDNLGDTAWDPDGDGLTSSLAFDLGKVQPVLELQAVHARYLLLEIVKPRATVPVQLAELRILTPLQLARERGTAVESIQNHMVAATIATAHPK